MGGVDLVSCKHVHFEKEPGDSQGGDGTVGASAGTPSIYSALHLEGRFSFYRKASIIELEQP